MRELVRKKGDPARAAEYALRFLLGAILSGGTLRGGYAPFALGLIAAAGPGARGLSALAGAALGAWLFMDFSAALRYLASALLLFTANNAFAGSKLAERKAFWPAMTAGLTASVETVYLLQAGGEQAACLLLSLCLAAVAAQSWRIVLTGAAESEQQRLGASLAAAVGLLLAFASVETRVGFAPGRAVAMLLVMFVAYRHGTGNALSAALCVGLTMDLAARGGFLYAGVYGAAALLMSLRRRGRRAAAAALFLAPVTLLALQLEAQQGMVLLYEASLAALAFLLLPRRLLRGSRQEPTAAQEETVERTSLRRSLEQSAAAMREIYDSVPRSAPQPEENPAALFDRAAEQVCRGCTRCEACWGKEGYPATFSALNAAAPALLRRGQAREEDFPREFAARCVRFPRFLSAVESELSAFLLRRQYRSRLHRAQSDAVAQYARMSELLRSTAVHLDAAACTAGAAMAEYRMGRALRPKTGEAVCGDTLTHFETEAGELCLLLSDGMGSGEAARRESALAVRLAERLLRAGIAAPSVLKTLNTAFALRAEAGTGAFTTLDLAVLSLRGGELLAYKYGAAPSYVKRNGRVGRIRGACLPAGLQSGDSEPEATRLRLEPGMFYVMISDGVADAADDEWLEDLLAGWSGQDPQQLVSAILAESRSHRGGSDDASVLALYFCGDETAAV